jgi:hypothetical protein
MTRAQVRDDAFARFPSFRAEYDARLLAFRRFAVGKWKHIGDVAGEAQKSRSQENNSRKASTTDVSADYKWGKDRDDIFKKDGGRQIMKGIKRSISGSEKQGE